MSQTIDLNALIAASRKDYRVDVVGIAKKLGLNVYSIDLPETQSGNICHDKTSNTTYIQVNRTHPLTRQRFTIAHELSHYVRHQDKLVEKGQLDRNADFKNDVEIAIEHEADKEAAAMLMPESIVKEYFAARNWTDKTKVTPEMIDEIADQFRVSRPMAITRMRELNIPVPYLSFA